MVMRLCQAEEPRAVIIGWDSLGVPTYRNELLESYQGGREFDPELVEQLELAPELLASRRASSASRRAGYEADDVLAAAVASERARGGRTLVATSDRDAFQLAAPDVTILQPQKGVSEMARIGPEEVRERYGVEPEQVPDFIALRGDPSDKIPGARGIGAKTAAVLLANGGSLDALLAAGRFPVEGDALEMYRRIATLDAGVPLPELPDTEVGLGGDRDGGAEAGARPACCPPGGRLELISHPALGHLHPTSHHQHPEREERIDRLLAVLGPARECRRGES